MVMYQIKPNHSNRSPGQHICLQVTWNERHSDTDCRVKFRSFRAVHAVRFRVKDGRRNREQEVYHEELGDFWEWFYAQLNPKLGTWCWCDRLIDHMVLLGMLRQLDAGLLVYERSVLSAKVSFLRCSSASGPSLWLDRCNWWRCPIGEIARLDSAHSHCLQAALAYKSISRSAAACVVGGLRDSVTALCRFTRVHDCGCLRVTAAGQSLAAYRHKYGPRRTLSEYISVEGGRVKRCKDERLWPRRHDCKEATDLERAAYYGGPTHCYYIGKVDTPIYVLDVRSIYPFVMKHNDFPCELLEVENDPPIDAVSKRLRHECGIAAVKIRSESAPFPVRKPDATYYITGSADTVLAGPELNQSIQRGTIERVRRVGWFRPLNIFGRFVDYFYARRCEYESQGNLVWADLCKLILNSLGSKFGQQTGEWKDDDDEVSRQPWGYWPVLNDPPAKNKWCRGIGGSVQTLVKPTESAHAFPAIPAHMCSLARVYMDRLMGIARSAGRVYYSAVDSIHCDHSGWSSLVRDGHVGDALGQLRLKGIFARGEYRGVGDYTLDGKVTRSGLPEGARPVGQDRYAFWDTECAAEVIDKGPKDELACRELTVTLPHAYRFGKIGKDGWIIPFDAKEVTS